MILAIATGAFSAVVIASCAFAAWLVFVREPSLADEEREREKIRKLALKALGEGKQGRREAA